MAGFFLFLEGLLSMVIALGNMLELRKIVGWVKQSATQQSPRNVGFHSSTQPTQLKSFDVN